MTVVSTFLIWAGCVFGLVLAQPQFKSTLTPVTKLYELQATRKALTDAPCEDTTKPGSRMIVSLGTVDPTCSGCFQVYPNCGGGIGGSYCLEYLPVTTLSYDKVPIYRVGLHCKDESDPTRTATTTVEIRLEPNTPPFFTTPTNAKSTVANAENVEAGGSVYAVVCSDPNNDAIEYQLTSPSNLFYIDSSGVIRATRKLSYACFASISFQVKCTDRRHDPVGPAYIEVVLSGANRQPRITGLDFSRDIPESEPVGTSLGSYTVDDDDTPTCQIATQPPESLQFFQLDTVNKRINVKSPLDYERATTRNTNVTLTCSDGFCTSRASYIFVRVTDVNEQITLIPSDFSVSTYEGRIDINPNWTPIDPDINDKKIYTIISGNTNGRFTINPETGVVTSTIDYDVDQNAMPPKDTLVVKVTDQGGLTSTATMTINILDTNDNRPVFTQGSQTLVINDCTSTQGTTIGSVSATDRDSALDGNNVLYFSGGNGPITVDSKGSIIVTGVITAPASYSVSVTASDSGTGPKGALTSVPPATVVVVVTPCPTTVVTTPPTTQPPATATTTAASNNNNNNNNNNGNSNTNTNTRVRITLTGANSQDSLDENLGWVVFAGLLATVLLAALAYMLWRFCYLGGAGGLVGGRCTAFCNNACADCCTPRPPPRAVVPYRGPQPPPGNKGFWKERYPDDDYVEQPDRDRTPTPAYMEGNRPLALEPTNNWRSGRMPPHYYVT